MDVFNDYAYYYNLFYENKDYHSEAETISDILQRNLNYRPNKFDKISILNLGCGTGRHDIELISLHPSWNIDGVDLSAEMIKIAKGKARETHCKSTQYSVADIREYIPNKKYDAVVSLFHVMSYQTTNEDILNVFKNAAASLDSGGIFLFDCWYGPGVITEKPERRIKIVEDEQNKIIRHAEPVTYPNENIVDVNYNIYVISKITSKTSHFKEIHRMRYFFKPELEYFLKIAGFELINCFDCNSLSVPDYNSWTAFFVAKKRYD